VKALPATHEVFRKLARIYYVDDSAREAWLDEVQYVISRVGFHSPYNAQDVIHQLIEITDASLAYYRQTSAGFH